MRPTIIVVALFGMIGATAPEIAAQPEAAAQLQTNDDRFVDVRFESPSKIVRLMRAKRAHEVSVTPPDGIFITWKVLQGAMSYSFTGITGNLIFGTAEQGEWFSIPGGVELTLRYSSNAVWYLEIDR